MKVSVRRKFFQPRSRLCPSVPFYPGTSIMPQVQRIIRRANSHPLSHSHTFISASESSSIYIPNLALNAPVPFSRRVDVKRIYHVAQIKHGISRRACEVEGSSERASFL